MPGSLVIDHLNDVMANQNSTVLYFYLNHSGQDQQSPTYVMANLLKQLESRNQILTRPLRELHERLKPQGGHPDIRDLKLVLVLALCDYKQVFIIIDALDECDIRKHRRVFLGILLDLAVPPVKVFVTSRPHPEDIKISLYSQTKIKIQASDTDVRKYLHHQIEEDGPKDLLDENLKEEIVTTIIDGAQGMSVNALGRLRCFI